MKLSDYVVEFIARQGVRHVFYLPGGGAMHLNDSLGHHPLIKPVVNYHEQACAIAAEAYARVTNNLGVCLVTTGPGGTNAITGVAAAWQDSTPCLFISGQVKRSDLTGDSGVRQLGVQEIDIVSIIKPITKYAVTIMDPNTIRHHLEKANWLARNGRPGPVWIDIPLDVQAAEIESEQINSFHPDSSEDKSAFVAENVLQVLEMLQTAHRPVLIAGNGIRLSGAQEKFMSLVQELGIPVLTTRLGVDLFPYGHKLCCGMPGTIASRAANFTLQNSDLLLIIGARMDLALIAYAPERLAPHAKKIMVNIDEAEIRKLDNIIDIPIVADVGHFIEEMLRQAQNPVFPNWSQWITQCQQWKAKYPFELPPELIEGDGLSMYDFSKVLSDSLNDGDIVLPGNSGFAAEIFLTVFRAKSGQRIFHNKGTGAMGFCQPAAIGACLASGRKRTVCVDGDGGFQLNIQELQTVRRLNLPIKFFVINNQGFASIRASQQGYFKRLTGADTTSGLTLPDYKKVASAYGLDTACIRDIKGIENNIAGILRTPDPVVCEVLVKPDEPRAPRVASIQKNDGSMQSMPLENMWPYLSPQEIASNMGNFQREDRS